VKRLSGRIVVGVVLLVLAVLFTLNALDLEVFKRVTDFAAAWWPAALVVIGVVGLVSGGSFGFNLVLALVGVALLAEKVLGSDTFSLGRFLVPFVLVVVAILVFSSAFHARRPKTSPASRDPGRPAGGEEHVHVFSAFGGHEARNASSAFRYAEVTAIFGGSSLDLRDATLAPEGAHVEATALFGGADVVVPEGWALEVTSTPIFGGVDNRTVNPGKAADGQPTLHVNATAVFGGVGIKNRPDRER
jgi:predicted membrane protein